MMKNMFYKIKDPNASPFETETETETEIKTILEECFLNMMEYKFGRQEDVAELYDHIFDKSNLQTFVWFILRKFKMCENGKKKSVDDIFEISLRLEIPNGCNTISDLLMNYFKIKKSTEENQEVGCGIDDDSKGHTYEFYDVIIPNFNKYLFIQLGRNVHLQNKNKQRISIDYEITIGNNKFVLDGFIVHYGLMTGFGHYIYIKVNDETNYTSYSDDYVDSSTNYNTRDFNENVYCLLYKKVT
jgi:hypothetical protein